MCSPVFRMTFAPLRIGAQAILPYRSRFWQALNPISDGLGVGCIGRDGEIAFVFARGVGGVSEALQAEGEPAVRGGVPRRQLDCRLELGHGALIVVCLLQCES